LIFDGVLHSYTSGWQGATVIPDPPVPGAIEFIADALASFNVVIYSSRSHEPGGIAAMQDWFRRQDAELLLLSVEFPQHKPSAFVTLDDRALTFTGVWPDIETLKAFKPWNKP
jgi:hypothetical protein